MPGLPSLLAALGAVGVGFALISFVIAVASAETGTRADLTWVGANLLIGIVLLVSAAAMNVDALRERMSSGEARRAGKYGTSAVLSTVLGIALLGMLGFLSTRYHHRFDWSEQKVHTLSDQSQKVLEGLEQDVSVTALVSAVDQGPVRELLDRYAYESERFRVEYADPNEKPGLLQTLSITPQQLGERGLVHIALGGESVEVSEIDETHITNAMVKLTRTGEKVVYFVSGHGEDAIEGEDAAGREGFARAADALRNENYRIAPLLLGEVKDVPEDADVVIVAGAKSRLFDEELARARPLSRARRRAVRARRSAHRRQLGREAARVGRRPRQRHRDRPRARAVRPRGDAVRGQVRPRESDHQGLPRSAQRRGDVPRGAQRARGGRRHAHSDRVHRRCVVGRTRPRPARQRGRGGDGSGRSRRGRCR